MKEIVKKVEKHNKAIAYAFFGKLEEIEICKIKCITDDQALLVFGQNQKVLYINGDVTRESGYQKYLIWFNQNVNQKNRNYIKNILIYDGYGFVEYIEDFSRDERCEDKRFNQKYGELIAIVWSLCGKLITLEHIGVKEGMPVVKNVCSLLDGEIGCKELPAVDEIQEWIGKQHNGKEELDQIMQGYATQKAFIEDNKADIEMLIRLCFGERV